MTDQKFVDLEKKVSVLLLIAIGPLKKKVDFF